MNRKILILFLIVCTMTKLSAQSLQYDIAHYPFSMRGSYLTIFQLGEHTNFNTPGMSDGLFIRKVTGRRLYEYMIKLELLENGRTVKPVITATPEKVTLTGQKGSVEICFEDTRTIRFRIQDAELQFSPLQSSFLLEYSKDRLRLLNGPANDFFYMLSCLNGDLRYSGNLFPDKATTHPNLYKELFICLKSSGKEIAELALEEFESEWIPRTYNPSFDACVERNKQAFTQWEKKIIPATSHLADAARLAAYINWSCLVESRGMVKRESMMMSKNWMNMVWSWDHCFNAMAMAPSHTDVAWNQLMCIFDHQSKIGSLPDSFDNEKEHWGIVKTPIHGWALGQILDNTDWIDTSQLSEIYEPLCAWTNFWFSYRDFDKNGIPQYNHSYESFDDCTPLDIGFPLEAPELCTFLILQMETLSRVATLLGKYDETIKWKEQSDQLMQKMLNRLWTGERFATKKVNTENWNKKSMDFLQYVPLLLGQKLPADVRNKMIHSLKESGLFTPYGIATESTRSPFFDPSTYTRGSIWAPVNIFLLLGLAECGETNLAKELATVYCNHLATTGFPEKFSAMDGSIQADPEYTWTTSVFLILAQFITHTK